MKNQFTSLSGKELAGVGHNLAETLGADTPLIEIAKLVSEMATRLDCAIARSDELQRKLDGLTPGVSAQSTVNTLQHRVGALAAECKAYHEVTLRIISMLACSGYDAIENSLNPAEDLLFHAEKALDTPVVDEVFNSARAEGVHFAANRILAAWEAGFINATPTEAADVAGAVLSALEFLANAQPDEFKRDYADSVITRIRAGGDKS